MKRGPSKKWKDRPDVEIKEDRREVCNKHTPGGQAEYKSRLSQLFYRQFDPVSGHVLCCNCLKPMWCLADATFEHENGRHPSRIDERLEVDGKRLNGASHKFCNFERGSRRTKVWHGPPEVLHV